MKQRIISLLLAAMLCLSLTACGDETGELDNGAENIEAPVGDISSDGQGEGSTGTTEVDGMTLGAGLELGEVVAQLDEHPNRAIRRSTKPIVQTVGTMLDGTPLSNDFYFYRNTLNDHGKQAYDLIRAGLLEGKATIQMTVPVSTDDIFLLFSMVIYDNPDIFWARTSLGYSYNNYGNVTSITPEYYDLVDQIPDHASHMESAVSDALADMWSLDSDAERVKYAHDYLTSTIEYVAGSSYNQSAYSALTLGQSVCAGYARAFQYMMQKMGIPCAYVVGYAGENHAWNLVQLDGEHYAMDVTWDDPLGNPPDQYYYNYFNLTDSQMSSDHIRKDPSTSLPWASGTTYSFHNAFGSYGTDFNAIQGDLPDGEGGEGQPVDGGSDNPYLPSGSGDNPYLPSGSDASGSEWDDIDWDDWDYDDYEDLGYDWWNALDENWALEDWTDYGDGTYEIWDEETQCYYFYDESDGTFGCMDATDETFYLLDFETGEWIPLN